MAEKLLQAGGLVTVTDARDLEAALDLLLEDRALASQRGRDAAGTVAANRGAVVRARAMIADMAGAGFKASAVALSASD